MKQTSKMSRAIGQLEKMFNVINTEKFNGELPTPIITIQSKPLTWGSCSRGKIWKRKDEERYELNIAAESASGPIEEILDTMIHEMIHLYCQENDIQEVSRNGGYHNKQFKKLAEEKGLKVVNTGAKYGWNTTAVGNDYLIEYALEHDWTELEIHRDLGAGLLGMLAGLGNGGKDGQQQTQTREKTPGTRTSSTRKYICPKCGMSVRATKTVYIICGNCLEKMIEA